LSKWAILVIDKKPFLSVIFFHGGIMTSTTNALSKEFEVQNDKLFIRTPDLSPQRISEFESSFQELLNSNTSLITLDFTNVYYISSVYLSYLLKFHERVRSANKELVVVISQKTSKMLTFAELHRLIPFKMYVV
jgi:anti-anti-sigma regulatory factor